MMQWGFLACILIIFLAALHFGLKAAQDCIRRPGHYGTFWCTLGVQLPEADGKMPNEATSLQPKAAESDVKVVVGERTDILGRLQHWLLPREVETKEELPLYMVVKVEGDSCATEAHTVLSSPLPSVPSPH